MVRYLVLLAVLSMLLAGCVVVHSDKYVTAVRVESEATAPATALQ
jgi:hypothetical protein